MDERPVTAMHANLLRALDRIGHLTARSAVVRDGGWQLIDAGMDLPQFNLALATGAGGGVPQPGVPMDWFAERGVRFSFMLRAPGDERLMRQAQLAGYEVAEREPSMLCSALPPLEPLPAGLTVRTVKTPEDIERYGRVDGEAWHELTLGIARTVADFPDFTMLLGEADGEPVATSMAVVTGGIVGIYNVQTRPALQGRGIGRAMTLAAIDIGRAARCTAASLQSTAAGVSVYQKLGFEPVYGYVVLRQPA
jgi:GNAT superfamily N-acetyltransferase